MQWRDWLNGMWRRHPGAEAWLDALLPIAVLVVGVQRGGDPPALVLTLSLWLALKLILKALVDPPYWVLLGVLLVCEATLLRQTVAVASPTDLLLFLLAFSVGLGRTRSQWLITAWMVSLIAIVALTTWHGVADQLNSNVSLLPWGALQQALQDVVVRIGGIAINRSAYLLGFVVLSAWSLFRHARQAWVRYPALVLALLAYAFAFLTGSRAGVGVPVLVIVVTELCWRCRHRLSAMATPLAIGALAVLLASAALLYQPGSPLAYRSRSDSGRAEVAHCFLRHSMSDPLSFALGHGASEISSACKSETRNPRFIADGLSHAHNVFLQILADHGAVALVVLAIFAFSALRASLLLLASGECFMGFLSLSSVLFFLGFGLVESTLLHVSLLQVCSGYLLASAWPAGGRRRASRLSAH